MPTNKKEVQLRADAKRSSNPERILYVKELQQQPHIKKSMAIARWKRYGVISTDYDALYDKYLNTNSCEKCNVKIEGKGRNKKCLDHCHTSGLFRQILCNNCNWNCNTEERKLRTDKRFPIRKTAEEIKETNKLWNVEMSCECGAIFKKREKSRHEKSKKHLNNMSKINI